MNWMCALVLAASPAADNSDRIDQQSLQAAHQKLHKAVQTGTLLVSRGDCLAVRVYTSSAYTHVATVVVRSDRPVVYDSANGAGVRRLPLKKYLASQSAGDIHVFQPVRRFSKQRGERLSTYLDSQLGRPYAVTHHVTGERGDGVHCSEYATDGLQHCGLIKAKEPARVSPASLIRGVTKHKVYRSAGRVTLKERIPRQSTAETWYGRAWECTSDCTRHSWRKVKGWFACR